MAMHQNAIVTHDMVVRTKACLKSIFWSLCPLVARNTDIPTKKSNRCRNKEIDPVLVIIYKINKTGNHHKT